MILIIGSNKDDTLYFENVVANKRREMIFNHYEVTFGTISSQNVIIVSGVYSNYESSIVTTYILNKYFIVLVFVVGKALAYTSDIKIGDIVISKKTYLGDVDLIEEHDVSLGQIPLLRTNYPSPNDIIDCTVKGIETRTEASYRKANFISSSTFYTKVEQLSSFKNEDKLFGNDEFIVFDNISGGVAVACELHEASFISVKVISRKFLTNQSSKDYQTVLRNYTSVGKAVVFSIVDIGKNQILRGK